VKKGLNSTEWGFRKEAMITRGCTIILCLLLMILASSCGLSEAISEPCDTSCSDYSALRGLWSVRPPRPRVNHYKIAAEIGSWAEYEVKEAKLVEENVTVLPCPLDAYGQGVKVGDRLKYQLVSTAEDDWVTPLDSFLGFIDIPLCDAWINEEKKATNHIVEPIGLYPFYFRPFLPTGSKFWDALRSYLHDVRTDDEWYGNLVVNLTFAIEPDEVHFFYEARRENETRGYGVEVKIDANTGIIKRYRMFKWEHEDDYTYEARLTLELISTSFTEGPVSWGTWLTWLIIGVAVAAIVMSSIIIIRRRTGK